MFNIKKENSKTFEKVQRLTDRLQEGLRELVNAETFKSYLNLQSKFHSYSVNNVILIYMQRPDATYVAGYKTWQTEFERHVIKGEKGIEIFAPVFKKKKPDDVNVECEDTEYTFYRSVHVYDVNQTEGKEFPLIKVNPLNGVIPEYSSLVAALIELSPVPVSITELLDTKAFGRYMPLKKLIEIRSGMSQKQTLKTLLHEISHAKSYEFIGIISELSYEQQEILAESVAYIVSNYLGIDTSEYSFTYVSLWGASHTIKEFQKLLKFIQLLSNELIDDFEKRKGVV